MVKYLQFHNSSFALQYLFNVVGKATVWHTPCFCGGEMSLSFWLERSSFYIFSMPLWLWKMINKNMLHGTSKKKGNMDFPKICWYHLRGQKKIQFHMWQLEGDDMKRQTWKMTLDWNCQSGKSLNQVIHWSGWPGGQRIQINFFKKKLKIILNIWRQKNSQLSMAACRYNRLYYIPFWARNLSSALLCPTSDNQLF